MHLYRHEIDYIGEIIDAMTDFYQRTMGSGDDIRVGWEQMKSDIHLPIVADNTTIGYVGYTDAGSVGFLSDLPDRGGN